MKKNNVVYESVSYNKDLLNGEIYSETKIKRKNGIKGKVRLELFDAKTGQKTTEAYTENLIPDLYFKDTFLNQFLSGIMAVGNTRQSYNYNWFNYLYLTDHDKPEHPSEQRVMGNVIGYAHRNSAYSGNDPQRGTINLAESSFVVTDSKLKVNFVFDFPTHAANGRIESIYWAEADPANKDYAYMGASIFGRESGDNNYYIDSTLNPKRYWAIYYFFGYAVDIKFTSPTKGWGLLDGKSTSVTQTPYLQFPENLKGHWLMIPFDLNANDIALIDQAVKLLNSEGNPLIQDSNHAVRKYDGLTNVFPYTQPDGNFIFIGYYLYSISSDTYMRIYKWSKVGVQLSFVDVNMSQKFKDVDYNIPFSYSQVLASGVYLDGCIDIVGYTNRLDQQFNEQVYTSRWIRVDAAGNKIGDMNIKPKIGNSTWFGLKGMDSGNIERRCRISQMYRSANKIYLYYTSVQGGAGFYQVITPSGNLLEPYKAYFGLNNASYYSYHNILGTDRWISRYYGNNRNYQLIQWMLLSRPIGAHTKLTQPVEKTEANTMKIQYMFEIDLVDYGEDYF
ncbi:hypothetical protein [Clostridium thermarum]|uniref:hypothetical protein n=1 Tax=Clostridium thermarum TaxID=1716543 RepID=UPI001122B1C7|nr:hypothetical protein [Clostridium thermarum]